MPQELSMNLKRIETLGSAFDIIRLLNDSEYALDSYDICEDLSISERRFGKAIKRLVTTGFVSMDADRCYSLTDNGYEAAEELNEFFADGGGQEETTNTNKIQRRLILAVPQELVAKQENTVHVGIEPTNATSNPASMVLRVTAINATVSGDGDEMFNLGSGHYTQAVQITPEAFTQARIKVQVFQLSPSGQDITVAGGLYTDVDITLEEEEAEYIGYGANLQVDPV